MQVRVSVQAAVVFGRFSCSNGVQSHERGSVDAAFAPAFENRGSCVYADTDVLPAYDDVRKPDALSMSEETRNFDLGLPPSISPVTSLKT